ncbi:BTAD domain-containing putative transcriptional regulator [Streptacidiphilus sp. N1-10]|uniref:BTAD domain-containing putative transcriptional regulator n=1 Tax=Streptacidiphilus jeojiensis TaxID=3229225 RepID=A0ABV6XZ45_9ACTN
MRSGTNGMETGLRFRVLGEVRGQLGDRALRLGSPQQMAVLVRLLLNHGHSVSIDELVDGIWGSEPPPRAIGTVRTYISRLRTELEPDRASRTPAQVLLSTGDGYTLRIDPDCLDLHTFERLLSDSDRSAAAGEPQRAVDLLTEALALWRGGALSGVPGGYAEGQRRRLGELWLSAVESRIGLDLELGNTNQVIAALGPLTAEFPLRERLRALLMLALYRSGRQSEALGVHADTRRLLIDELGVEPGPELAVLQRRILAADPELTPATRPTTAGAASADGGPGGGSAPATVPAQLPPDIPDFSGRTKLVEEIVDALHRSPGQAVAICALAGIGGVGKTTLAVHCAHEVRGSFPDGQLYLDLRGAGSNPVDPAAALAEFLEVLGIPPAQLPDTVERRTALYRSLLADRRVLVLLDNVRDSTQIRPLLPSTGSSTVLMTGRGRPAGLPGVRLVDIDVFQEEEAVELFAAVAGAARVAAEPAAVREVVGACSLLPLAVRIVASRLAVRPSWTVASLARRLADQRRRLDELQVGDLAVEATFQLGYLQLSEDQARAFRLLSLPDGADCSTSDAAALLGLPVAEAESLAESLVDAGLLESEEPGRYRYHDLLRLFARRRAEETDPEPVRRRSLLLLLDHLLACVRNASRTLEGDDLLSWSLHRTVGAGEPLTDPDEARDWLRAQRALLLAVLGQSLRQAPEESLPAVVDLLLGWMWVGAPTPHAEDFHAVLAQALSVARRTDGFPERRDARGEARLHYLVGMLHGLSGDGAPAEASLRRSLECLDPARGGLEDHPEIHYTVAAELAVVLNAAGRSEEALPYLELARDLCRGLGHQADEARLLGNIARAHLTGGRPGQALDAAREAVRTARAAEHPSCLADALYQLGTVLLGNGQYGEASTRLIEAVEMLRRQERYSTEGCALARLSSCYLAMNAAAEAVRCAEQALELGRQVSARYCQGLAQEALGRALVALGQSARGRGCLTEAQRLFEELEVTEAIGVRNLLDTLPASA